MDLSKIRTLLHPTRAAVLNSSSSVLSRTDSSPLAISRRIIHRGLESGEVQVVRTYTNGREFFEREVDQVYRH